MAIQLSQKLRSSHLPLLIRPQAIPSDDLLGEAFKTLSDFTGFKEEIVQKASNV